MAISRRLRRTLMIFAVFVFGLAAYIAIQYAQGYEFSFDERRFVRTGAVTLDANADGQVSLDGEPAGATSFLGNTFSMGGLLPGTYLIRLEREGWSTWSKEVTVQEGLLTDIPRVLILPLDEASASRSIGEIEAALTLLVPASASPEYTLVKGILNRGGQELASNVLGFDESPDGAKLMWWTRNEVAVLWLSDTGYQPFRKAGEQDVLTRLSTRLEGAVWWPDSDHIAVKSSGVYRIVELDTRGGTNIITIQEQ